MPSHKRRIGLVFQDNRLLPHLSVECNLLFGYRNVPRAQRRIHPRDVIALLGLDTLLERDTATLSGGESKRVAIGRALLTSPRLLLLDEPLHRLDAQRRYTLLTFLLQLHESIDIDIVYVSHTLSDFLSLVDRAILIRDRKTEVLNTPEDLLSKLPIHGDTGGLERFYRGRIVSALPGAGLTEVDLDGVRLQVAIPDARKGAEVLVVIRADDVLLAVGNPPHTSARNRLPGRIIGIDPYQDHLIARVDIGKPIYAEVSREAVNELALKPGSEVQVLLKAHALRGALFNAPN